jgi:cbb3-type cytochrome oxidase subunit 3
MKIVIDTLSKIEGIEIYPIISLLIFFTFFVGVGYLVYRTPKSVVDEMSRMPLDDNDGFSSNDDVNENLKH